MVIFGLSHKKLCFFPMQSVYLAENFLDHLPIFRKLVHLNLSMVIGAHTIGALLDFFLGSPNLESIVFSKVYSLVHTAHLSCS